MPNPLDLERVRSYCATATSGPWCHRQAGETRRAGHPLDWIADTADRSHHKIIIGRECLYGGTPDYAFIAAARTDLPAAVEEIEALRAENADLKKALAFYAGGGHFEEDTEWNCAKMGDLPPPPKIVDHGEVAQSTLARWTEIEKGK